MKRCAHLISCGHGTTALVQHGEDGIHIGRVMPYKHGDPIGPETSLLEVKDEPDGSKSVETVWSPKDYDGCDTPFAHAGPALVSSPAFRAGWDAVFGKASSGEDVN